MKTNKQTDNIYTVDEETTYIPQYHTLQNSYEFVEGLTLEYHRI